jgi:hypothetical protein
MHKIPQKTSERTSRMHQRHECAGGCGRFVFTAYCDTCAPPVLGALSPDRVRGRNKKKLDLKMRQHRPDFGPGDQPQRVMYPDDQIDEGYLREEE